MSDTERLDLVQCIELALLAKWAHEHAGQQEARAVMYLVGEAIRSANLLPENTERVIPDGES